MKKAMDNFDLIIKNGEVFDGTGAASKKVDIAVKDGVIAKISESILDSADKTIDASGKVVTPGFVDVHMARHVNSLTRNKFTNIKTEKTTPSVIVNVLKYKN